MKAFPFNVKRIKFVCITEGRRGSVLSFRKMCKSVNIFFQNSNSRWTHFFPHDFGITSNFGLNCGSLSESKGNFHEPHFRPMDKILPNRCQNIIRTVIQALEQNLKRLSSLIGPRPFFPYHHASRVQTPGNEEGKYETKANRKTWQHWS